MTEETHNIARLDRSKPPPGCSGPFELAHRGCWHVRVRPGEVTNCEDGPDEALAAAWTHHEARHDPPGMAVWHGSECLVRCGALLGWGPSDGATVFPARLPAEARAAAWAWYWRRVAVAEKLDALARQGRHLAAVGIFEAGVLWPDPLTWTDDYTSQIEEVLRG